MFPQSLRPEKVDGPTARRIIQTDGAGAAIYRLSCAAEMVKNYRREVENTKFREPLALITFSHSFLTSSCVSVSTCVTGAFTCRGIHL